jgi:DNA-binding transcriptional LysR family regulator
LCRNPFVCVLPRDHPLVAKPTIRPHDLAAERFVSFPSDSEFRVIIDQVFADAGVERRLLLEAPMAPTICALVARGLGVSILNPYYVGAFESVIATRPFRPGIAGAIRILLPRHRQRTLLIKAFIEFAHAHIGRRKKYNAGL